MKLINTLVVAALVLFTAGVVHADDISSGDSRIVIGGDDPSAPSCTGFQAAANVDGVLSADCLVAGTPATTITFAAPASEVLGGALSCTSDLTLIGWTATTGSIDGGTVDTCTFTAPSHSNLLDLVAADLLDVALGLDGKCDYADFLVGIPVGCAITFNSPAGATIDNTEALTSGAVYDVSPTGVAGLVAFPEPGTLALLVLGLFSLALLRRRAVQQ